MKLYSVTKYSLLLILFLTGCASQQTPVNPTPTPIEQGIPIPEIFQHEPINYGIPYFFDWTDDGDRLAVMTRNKVILHYSQDWSTGTAFPLDGISEYIPFSINNGRLIGFFPGDKPMFREYDSSTMQFLRGYPIGEKNGLMAVSYETMTYVGWEYACNQNTPRICAYTYSLNEIAGNKRIANIYLHNAEVKILAPTFFFSPDGRYLAGYTQTNQLIIWDAQTAEMILSTTVDSRIYGIDSDPTENILLIYGNDGTARIWDINHQKEIAKIDHQTEGIYYARFLKKSHEILVVTKDKKFARWSYEIDTGQILKTADLFTVNEFSMNWGKNTNPQIELSHDEKSVAVLSNSTVRVWKLTGTPTETTIPGYNGRDSFDTQFSTDGKTMAISDDHQIIVYGLRPYRQIAFHRFDMGTLQQSIFLRDTTRILSVIDDQFFDWNYETDQVITYKSTEDNPCGNYIIIFSKDGSHYLAGGYENLYVCSTTTHHLVAQLDLGSQNYHSGFSFSKDGSEVYSANDNRLTGWNVATGKKVVEISLPGLSDISSHHSYLDNLLGYFDCSENTIKILNITDETIQSKIQVSDQYNSINISHNKRLVLAKNYWGFALFDAKTGNKLLSKDMEDSFDIFMNPVLDEFYTASYGAVTPWDYSDLASTDLYDRFIIPTPTPLSIPCSPGVETTPEPAQVISQTPTATPAPTLSAQDQELSIPTSPDSITADNILSLRAVQEIGESRVVSSAVSNDGKILAIATNEEIDIYDLGKKIKILTIPQDTDISIYGWGFNSDNTLLAFKNENGDYQIWSLAENKLIKNIAHENCWSPSLKFEDDDQSLIADCDNFYEKWDIKSGKLLKSHQKDEDTKVSPDGSLRLVSDEVSIRLINQQNQILKTFEYKHLYPITYMFNADGSLIYISFFDLASTMRSLDPDKALAQIWNISSLDQIYLQTTIHPEISSLIFDPYLSEGSAHFTNNQILTCLNRQFVSVYNTSDGKLINSIPGWSDCHLYSNGSRIITHDTAGNLSVWDIQNPKAPKLVWQLTGYNPTLHSIQFSADQDEVLSTTSSEFISTDLSAIDTGDKHLIGLPDMSQAVAISPDGRWIASIDNNQISILDRDQIKPEWSVVFTHEITPSDRVPSAPVFSSDGNQLAAMFSFSHIVLLNFSTGVKTVMPVDAYTANLQFSPDGSTLMSVDNQNGDFWNTETGQLQYSISGLGDTQVFHPGGKILITIDREAAQLHLVALPSGMVIRTLSIPEYVFNAVVSPDGKMVALSKGSVTDFISLKTGESLARIDDPITILNFSPDGKSMVTQTRSGKILVWKVE